MRERVALDNATRGRSLFCSPSGQRNKGHIFQGVRLQQAEALPNFDDSMKFGFVSNILKEQFWVGRKRAHLCDIQCAAG